MKQLDQKTQDKIQELQLLEQNFQNIILQKQTFQVELNEINSALFELENTSEAYELTGNILIKADVSELKKKLKEKKELAELRIKTLEKQEKSIQEKTESLQKELVAKLK